jgi:chemosensory pili system protein ChpA (sensor histidine kinase/response regulator)
MNGHRMNSPRDIPTTDDLSALAWVQDELRRSLDAAHKALRRFVKESEAQQGADVDAVDPSVLRSARQQLHQGVGALELVGLPGAAVLLRASELAVQRFVSRPQKLSLEAVETIERASFALLEYLSKLLAGKSLNPVAMFPQYRAVQELAGTDRVHPADLWNDDWRWRDVPAVSGAVAPRAADSSTRAEIESHLLHLMREGSPAAAVSLSDVFAGLAQTSAESQTTTLWRLAAALFEGQAQGLFHPDNYSKRVGSRLLAQVRMIERGESAASERLAQDLLFFCAQCESPGDGRNAPRLTSIRQAYGLARQEPVDYEVSRLGRFDPAWIVQARKRVAAAKDAWSSIAGGEMHRLAGLAEQFSLVTDSVKRLYPSGEVLADELTQAVAHTAQQREAPPAALAMEVATSVLYLEASLEDGDLDDPQMGFRVQRLASRIAAVRTGVAAEPLEGWMEDLYRRVSDRQTMGSVVQELRISLSESEKHIDQFFRDPLDRKVLIPVPNQMSVMRGVLSVLGMDQACAVVLRMRDDINGLIATEIDPQQPAARSMFERLAGNLGALGFLIDMLSVQPQLAKSLFVFDADAGTLNPLMGRRTEKAWPGHELPAIAVPVQPRLIEQVQSLAVAAIREDVPMAEVSRDLERLSHEALVADQPALAATVAAAQAAFDGAADAFDETAAREQLAVAMNDFVVTASDVAETQLAVVADKARGASASQSIAATPAGTSGLEDDVEMREVFLEEAREVLSGAKDALGELTDEPSDVELMTTLRRAFHTLKGSSRMVGLGDFGEAAWSCEQLFNARLAEAPHADEPVLKFAAQALAYLDDWVEFIAKGETSGHDASAVRAAADALRLDGHSRPLLLPAAATWEEFSALQLPADLPSAVDLDLPPAFDLLPATQSQSAAEPTAAAAREVTFELDLRALELPAEAPAPVHAAPVSEEVSDDSVSTVPLPLLDDEAPAAAVGESVELVDLDLDLSQVKPASESTTIQHHPAQAAKPQEVEVDQVRVVGPLRIGIPLFNIYLNEADELSRRLTTEVAEWSMELHRPVGESAVALAHSLAGSSATVGYTDLSYLARALEHALMRSQSLGWGSREEAQLFTDAAEEIRRLLHQFAAGFLKNPSGELLQRLADHEMTSVHRLSAVSAAMEPAGEAFAEDAAAHQRAEAQPPAQIQTPPQAKSESEAPISIAAQPQSEHKTAPLPAPVATSAQVGGETSKPPVSTVLQQMSIGGLGQVELKRFTEMQVEGIRVEPARADALDDGDDLDAVDAVDAELFPIFEEEGQELLAQLGDRLRDWARSPSELTLASACMRTLHTLKGGARLAGAMRLGELAHRLETAIEHLLAHGNPSPGDIEPLHGRADALNATFEALQARDAKAYEEAATAVAFVAEEGPVVAPALAIPTFETVATFVASQPGDLPLPELAVTRREAAAVAKAEAPALLPQPSTVTDVGPHDIDWSRFINTSAARVLVADRPTNAASQSAVRVRASLLERLVNQAGEVSITRSRIESEVGQIKSSLGDLTDNLERLRGQLRDIELQAETQMASRMEAAKAAAEKFDPLEFDRFTRFQELTRMMAESVNDVATVQRTLQRTLESTEDELAAQTRLTRDLQDDLLRTRMVEFESMSDRLYRVARQAAKETGKQVRLDIVGGSIEVDRGVLDRMTGAFEHLLRNSVTHGIETPDVRSAIGKDPIGSIIVALSHEGNEVGVEFRDDGQGLHLQRIRDKGLAMGLLAEGAEHSEADIASLIFTPGFSTADVVTELAGRGIGMDVVRSEVNAMGGRIETATAWGKGTSFKLVLPLTTAVTQVVMLRCGDATIAVPSTLVEIVRRASPAEMTQAYAIGTFGIGERQLPFFWLGALLQMGVRGLEAGRRMYPVVVIRSAQQRIVVHVDDVLGNQEVVVKNLGPQLSRMPGLAGMTMLASGAPALIYNPVALATLYGESARAATAAALSAPAETAPIKRADTASNSPMILVVDDSLTVRRVTQRLLVREGYRVVLAKDGLEALERLAEEKPSVVLSDIEMPRMDGFDLVRNLRGDARWRDLPVIMITSRIAQKHRDHAAALGVDHYLGKPYSEEDLLALIGRYLNAEVT